MGQVTVQWFYHLNNICYSKVELSPSELHEYCDLKASYHRWAVSSEEGVLVFREKSKNVVPHPLIHALGSSQNKTKIIIEKMHGEVNFIKLFWNNNIMIRVEPSDFPIDEFKMKNDGETIESYRQYSANSFKIMLKRLLYNIYKYRHFKMDAILACPICKSRVICRRNEIICTKCSVRYPVVNKMPVMLQESKEIIV